MKHASGISRWRYPAFVWLIVLGAVFATETAVMVALPWILPEHPSKTLESSVDAVLLTIVIAPLLWWLLVRPLREANRVRAEFLGDLFTSIEADRRVIAHDLHDGVGQSLTMLVSGLRSTIPTISDPQLAQRCLELKQLAKQTLLDVKRLALGLRPSLLDDLGLAPALERVLADVRDNHPINITLDVNDIADQRLPGNVESAIFRIAQEALSNIVKHSQATSANLTVKLTDTEIQLEVCDNGVGIPPSKLRGRNPGHLGLTGMRERTTLLDGELLISSTIGHGTHLTVRIPITKDSQ